MSYEHDLIVITSSGETQISLNPLLGMPLWEFIEKELDTIMNEVNDIDE